jgi:uncharacterized alpha-E superfamily protein
MLARVAESLYWMARYVERSEDLTRLLSVNFHAHLDLRADSGQTGQGGWPAVIAITGDAARFLATGLPYTARGVSEFMLWHPANPSAVLACLHQARENARSVRDQISVEMWEHLNRLYLLMHNADHSEALDGPHEFFRIVRDGSQAFQGMCDATMTHGDAFEFIQLGKYLERAEKTARILDVKYGEASTLAENSPAAALHLIALLKSCSAFEPFVKLHANEMVAWRVAEYLLLNSAFPRAVAFGLDRCLRAVRRLADDSGRPSSAERYLGHLRTELEYLDIQDVLGDRLHPYLAQLVQRLNRLDDAIASTFFSTQVILPDRQAQQQQQQ